MGYLEQVVMVMRISKKLLEEATLFHEVKDQLWSVVSMLKKLGPFVMEIQRKQIPKMKEYSELLNEIDDAIDLYVTEAATGAGGMTPDNLKIHIEKFKRRLRKWHNHCLTSIPLPPPPPTSLQDDRVVVVGLEKELITMIERLMDKDPRRDVIPIVGPGGVGKTTLARRVYDHPTTEKNFPCRAWICGCSDYGLPITKLLQEIFNQVCFHYGEEEKMSLRDLANEIYKHLKSADRYLVVFDDVWRTQFWDEINVIFPDNNRNGGGRIIFTTRYDEVASYAMPRNPPYLQLTLNREESWTLYRKRVLSSYSSSTISDGEAHLNAEERKSLLPLLEPDHNPWRQCVDKCDGLPAAIVELAAQHQRLKLAVPTATATADKEDDKHWDETFPKGVWELKYNNLPDHLKPCLLYLGVLNSCCFTIFKELLIAECLVVEPLKTQVEGMVDCTGVAEKYVNELINLDLVEVVSKHWNGQIKEITISKRFQLMNFCRIKATEENLFEMVEFETTPLKANRIAARGFYETHFVFRRDRSPMEARSILRLDFPPERICWDPLLENTSLRVLDLGVDFTDTIPRGIGSLILLRYLRINYKAFSTLSEPRTHNKAFSTLPESICNLWNLQFLRLKNNSFKPETFKSENFWKMKQLKHLLCTEVLFRPPPPPAEGGVVLYNLQRLKYLAVNCCTKKHLSSMPNLVRLGVGGDIKQKHIYKLSIRLSQLKHLQKLVLRAEGTTGETEFPPRWDLCRLNITHLTFKSTRLPGKSMGILGKLPNLRCLKLASNAVNGDTLDTNGDRGDGWFQQLKCLKLQDLSIRRWNMPVGAMPNLEVLVIRDCTSLQALPSEALQKINTLREMEIHNYVDPAVETAALEIQKFMKKNQLQLRLKKREKNLETGMWVTW